MKFKNANVITCFFGTNLNNNNFINITVFDPEKNFEVIQSSRTTTKNIIKFHNIKSAVMTVDKRQKALICSIITIENSLYLFYAGYDIISNTVFEGYIMNHYNCIIDTQYLTLNYFRETEEFISSFLF